jgi:hypothetical protein
VAATVVSVEDPPPPVVVSLLELSSPEVHAAAKVTATSAASVPFTNRFHPIAVPLVSICTDRSAEP